MRLSPNGLRLVTVQTKPLVGQFEANARAASRLLSPLPRSENPTLLVLPELALTGYGFPSRSSIEPHLESQTCGKTLEWSVACARRHNCIVAAGYPELDNGKRYNSVRLVSADGDVLGNYRKTHLFSADEPWGCEESPQGFKGGCFAVPGVGRVQMGICMDINPYKFEAPFDAKEFATHVEKTRPDVVIIAMAWQRDNSSVPLPVYWIDRLSPNRKQLFRQPTVIANQCSDTYGGESCILLPDGRYATAGPNLEGFKAVTIHENRKR